MKVFFALSALSFLLFSIHVSQALYTAQDKVINLTPANFNDKVIKSDDLWMIEFYAPWCGHCKSLAPDWKKAAEALSGIVKVGAVDMDAHPSLGQPYDVKGFPTLKFFGLNKNKPLDYSGQRTASGIVDFVLGQAKTVAQQRLSGKAGSGSSSKSSSGGSKKKSSGGSGDGSGRVIELTDSNFEELVMTGEDLWYVEFFAPWCGHCKSLAPQWESAARGLGGIAKLGAVDATVHTALANKYGIRGYPTIKIFKAGQKDKPIDYEGPRESAGIIQHAKNNAEANAKPKEVVQLTSEADFTANCEQPGSNICLVAFLPHILDTTAAERNSLISVLKDLAKKYARRPFSYVWAEAGSQFDFEQTLGGISMYPALVAVRLNNEKPDKSRYAPMVGAFSVETIGDFLRRLLNAKEATLPLATRPKLAAAEKWNGKDAPKQQIQSDDDVDISDIIGGTK